MGRVAISLESRGPRGSRPSSGTTYFKMLLQCSWVTCEMGEWLYPLQKEGCCWTRASGSSGSSRRVARRSENKQASARQQISCALGADLLPSHKMTGARSRANSCSRSRQSPKPDGTDRAGAPGSIPHKPGDQSLQVAET